MFQDFVRGDLCHPCMQYADVYSVLYTYSSVNMIYLYNKCFEESS